MTTYVWYLIIWIAGVVTTMVIETNTEEDRKWLDDFTESSPLNGFYALLICSWFIWPVFMVEIVQKLYYHFRKEYLIWKAIRISNKIFKKYGTTLEKELERIEQEKKDKEALKQQEDDCRRT